MRPDRITASVDAIALPVLARHYFIGSKVPFDVADINLVAGTDHRHVARTGRLHAVKDGSGGRQVQSHGDRLIIA